MEFKKELKLEGLGGRGAVLNTSDEGFYFQGSYGFLL